MLYLDYAKPVGNGYILNFFADKIEDIQEVSGGKEFVTKNGTNYGVPLASSTVVITYPDKSKKTFVLNGSGEWEESGAVVQSNYNENDPSSPEYIKNRPFHSEFKTAHTFEVVNGNFIIGTKITVKYDGIEYTDVVQSFDLNKDYDTEGDIVGGGTVYPSHPSEEEKALTIKPEEEQICYIGDGSVFGLEKRDFPFTFAPAKVLQDDLEGYVLFSGEEIKDVEYGAPALFNEKEYEIKPWSMGMDLLYIGNLSKLDSSMENTGEDFLLFFNYFNDINLEGTSSETYSKYCLIIFNGEKIKLDIPEKSKTMLPVYLPMDFINGKIDEKIGVAKPLIIEEGRGLSYHSFGQYPERKEIELSLNSFNTIYYFGAETSLKLPELPATHTRTGNFLASKISGILNNQFNRSLSIPNVVWNDNQKSITIEGNKYYYFEIFVYPTGKFNYGWGILTELK